MDYKDYYATLGIPADADEQAIRTAFRKLARVHHPDVAEVKQGATERFKEINEAYTVLSDPEKRRTYDLFRTRYERYQTTYRQPRPEPTRPASSSTSRASAGPTGARPSASASGPGPDATRHAPRENKTERAGDRRTHTRTFTDEDVERLFRGFMWAYTAASARSGERSGSTASSDFSDFFEALFGNRRTTASAGRSRTPDAAEVRPGRDIEVTAQLSLEEAFRGTTRTLTFSDGRKVEVTIPPGVQTGSKLRVRGHGERLVGRPLGDLYMTIEVQPHPVFVREGDDLKLRLSVPHEMALSSGEVQIPTLERSIQLKIPAGTHTGQSFRLRGQGMPSVSNPSTRGDLIALVEVQAPPSSSPGTSGTHSTARKGAPSRSQDTQKRPTAKATPKATRSTGGIRQALGLAMTALSLLILTAQGLMAPTNGWLWVATLSVILLAYAVAGRSLLAAGVGLLVSAGCVYLATQAELTPTVAMQQAWPLLPVAVGVILLSANPSHSAKSP